MIASLLTTGLISYFFQISWYSVFSPSRQNLLAPYVCRYEDITQRLSANTDTEYHCGKGYYFQFYSITIGMWYIQFQIQIYLTHRIYFNLKIVYTCYQINFVSICQGHCQSRIPSLPSFHSQCNPYMVSSVALKPTPISHSAGSHHEADWFEMMLELLHQLTRELFPAFCNLLDCACGTVISTCSPFYSHGLTLNPAWISNHIPVKCAMKLLIHFQTSTSTVAPLKFGNG